MVEGKAPTYYETEMEVYDLVNRISRENITENELEAIKGETQKIWENISLTKRRSLAAKFQYITDKYVKIQSKKVI